ncbi:ABC transporter ATP-binding protein [Aquihabitans sp. G128]|uniref:ABC transporter ATP-binding protein n=1 Tax=Aquihabitans sp. G128 TaxID=2849779 RepID=UPI001C227F89|nr:ABC transporter ATP-binding protein [Aquihabitans sp. G128]QXC61391.1 ABC transporter ATP-binding protein [Aquihabitans sp. G128]
MATLEVDDVSIAFGGHTVLAGASLQAEAGQITGLIGPNGAGKTTLFNIITGLLHPSTGRIRIDGQDVTELSLHKRARSGLARTFQQLELFAMLTVRENVRVAIDIRRRWSHERGNAAALTDAILERVGLAGVADERVTSLPTGQGRLVELGRALASQPKILLLDEPASGQDDIETERFGHLLQELAADGAAVVLVEHDMALVMEVCHQVHVLDLGHMIATGPPAEVQVDPHVLDAYLGTSRTVAVP